MKPLTIAESIQLLHPTGAFELRLLGAKPVAGVFDDLAKAEAAVAPYDGKVAGCYITLNPVAGRPVLNQLAQVKAGGAVADNEIDRRAWLLVDFDPDRKDPTTGETLFERDPKTGEVVKGKDGKPKKAKCPSTEEELRAAFARRDQVAAWLGGRGWPQPATGLSANGGHLLYRLDLPNDEDVTRLLASVLRALAARFGDDLVEVDTTVFNASRITKLYGTIAKKGKATEARPYRRSYLDPPTGELVVVDRRLLEDLAAEAPPEESTKTHLETVEVETKGEAVEWEKAAKDKGEGDRLFFDLDDLKRMNPIVAVARDLGLQVKAQGSKGNFVARCPAHTDAGRPNFTLNDAKGGVCFSCGFKADAIGLVAKVKGYSTGEAIRFLAARVGLKPVEGLENKTGGKGGETYPKAAPLPPDPSPYLAGGLGNNDGGNTGEAYPKPPSPRATEGDGLPYDPAAVTKLEDGRFRVEGGENVIAFYRYHFGGLPKDEAEGHALWNELNRLLAKPHLSPEEGDRASHLAGRVGYRGGFPPVTKPAPPTRDQLFAALLEYASPLPGDPPHQAAAWLEADKGLSFETQAAAGLCWLDWKTAAEEMKQRFDLATLEKAGLLAGGDLAFHKHRLLFPFRLRGEVVFVQGRNWSPDKNFRFFSPGSPPCPYNVEDIYFAKENGEPIFICEGATDTLTLSQSGRLAVGIVGTQSFKPSWAKAFAGLEVYLAFDGDDAGRKAARDVTKIFVAQGLPAPKTIPLPDGQDVTDFFRAKA